VVTKPLAEIQKAGKKLSRSGLRGEVAVNFEE
jgi:hypothetical protein